MFVFVCVSEGGGVWSNIYSLFFVDEISGILMKWDVVIQYLPLNGDPINRYTNLEHQKDF